MYNSLYGQIGNEISSYVDTTESTIIKGRGLLQQTLLNAQVDKAAEIYDYLIDFTAEKNISAFHFNEKIAILTILNRWERWDVTAKNYFELNKMYVYETDNSLYNALYSILFHNADDFMLNCNTSEVSEEQRKVVEYYLEYVENGVSEQYIQLNKEIKEQYPISGYSDFVVYFMPEIPTKASFGISMGPSFHALNGSLAQNFEVKSGGYMSMDFNIEKIYMSFYFDILTYKLISEFTGNTTAGELEFKSGEEFVCRRAGLKTGYFIARANRFHLSPYVNLSAGTLESTRFTSVESELEYKVFNTFVYGVGLHTELRITDFEIKDSFGNKSNSYLSVKLDATYDNISKVNHPINSVTLPSLNIGVVWGVGSF